MTIQTQNKTAEKREVSTLSWKPTVIIPKNIKLIIDQAHRKVGSIEWCGLLLYTITKGSFATKDIEFTVNWIHFMDVGTAGGTSVSGKDMVNIVDVLDDYPAALDCKWGYIHTHHSMSAFFSGTDWEELQDNVDKYPYYLSLIVNFAGNYVAKVATVAKSDSPTVIYKHSEGEVSFTKPAEIMVILDCDIEVESDEKVVNETIEKRLQNLLPRSRKNFISTGDFSSSERISEWERRALQYESEDNNSPIGRSSGDLFSNDVFHRKGNFKTESSLIILEDEKEEKEEKFSLTKKEVQAFLAKIIAFEPRYNKLDIKKMLEDREDELRKKKIPFLSFAITITSYKHLIAILREVRPELRSKPDVANEVKACIRDVASLLRSYSDNVFANEVLDELVSKQSRL